jgi:hypothetical protein
MKKNFEQIVNELSWYIDDQIAEAKREGYIAGFNSAQSSQGRLQIITPKEDLENGRRDTWLKRLLRFLRQSLGSS